MRTYAQSLGIKDYRKHRDGVLHGNKIYFAACAYRAEDRHTNTRDNGNEHELEIIAPLIFVSWQKLSDMDIEEVGRKFRQEVAISAIIGIAGKFVLNGLNVYRKLPSYSSSLVRRSL